MSQVKAGAIYPVKGTEDVAHVKKVGKDVLFDMHLASGKVIQHLRMNETRFRHHFQVSIPTGEDYDEA